MIRARLFETGAALTLVLVVVVLLWGSLRGLDLSDESLYLYDIGSGVASPETFSQFHVLIGWFTGSDFSIASLRQVSVLMDVVTAGLLGASAWWVARKRVVAVPPLSAWVTTAAVFQLLAHSWLPATPSYNSVGAWIANLVVGSTLLLLDSDKRWPLGLAVGVLLATDVFVKWTSALLFAIVLVAALGASRRPRGLVAVVAGLTFSLVLVGATGAGGLDLRDLRSSAQILSETSSHGPQPLIGRYIGSTVDLAVELLTSGLGLSLLLLVLLALLGPVSTWCVSAIVLLYGLLILVWDEARAVVTGNPSERRLLLGAVVVVLMVLIIRHVFLRTGESLSDISWRAGIVVLFVAPFVAAAGTDNDLWRQVETAAAPFAVLLVGMWMARPQSGTFVVLVLVLVGVQTVHASVVTPYRQVDLRLQDTDVSYMGLDVSLDPSRARASDDLRQIVHPHLKPGGRVFVGFRQPGLALVIDAEIAGPTWTGPQSQAESRLCPAIDRNREHFEQVVLVILTEPLRSSTRRCMVDAWPSFATFELVGTAGIGRPGVAPLQVLAPSARGR